MYEIKFNRHGQALRQFTVTLSAYVDASRLRSRPLTKEQEGGGYAPFTGDTMIRHSFPIYRLRPPSFSALEKLVREYLAEQARTWRAVSAPGRDLPTKLRLSYLGVRFWIQQDLEADICEHFFAGTDPTAMRSIFRQNRVSSQPGGYYGYGQTSHGLSVRDGTSRLSYDKNTIYSYNMPLGRWIKGRDGERVLLVNGDGGPTVTTRKHQRRLRGYLESFTDRTWVKVLRPHTILPFSVLQAAWILEDDVTLLDMTPATIKVHHVPCAFSGCSDKEMEHTHPRLEHFLGETLFRLPDGRTFLSGLDRNDSPAKRSFYLCCLSKPVNTVKRGIESLRPRGVPKGAKRQGEWFFVEAPEYKPKEHSRYTRVPIVSDNGVRQAAEMVRVNVDSEKPQYVVPGREGRHVASTLVIDDAVYARGVITDKEHSRLRLGPVWHRVVKNTALEGWRYDAVQMRAQVD